MKINFKITLIAAIAAAFNIFLWIGLYEGFLMQSRDIRLKLIVIALGFGVFSWIFRLITIGSNNRDI